MFSRSKAQAASLLAATFLAGGAVGALALSVWPEGDDRNHERERDRPRMSYVERLQQELGLTPIQRESVQVFLDRRQESMRDLWREVGPRFDSLRVQIRDEIMTVLDSTQQARFRELITRGDRRDSERRNGPRGSYER